MTRQRPDKHVGAAWRVSYAVGQLPHLLRTDRVCRLIICDVRVFALSILRSKQTGRNRVR